jgi:hypothetical protein
MGMRAARIDGSATWLNGAVVIVGGSPVAGPEIFVPAYACDENGEPVSAHTVDFCDVDRRSEKPDDPRDP